LLGLQKSAHAVDRRRSRIAAVAQIEDEAGVADSVPAETGWSGFTVA
jgi:hypothetical protein